MRTKTTPAVDRVYARVEVHQLGCWEFTGALNHGGYGIVQRGVRGAGTDRAHRIIYEAEVGPIPSGMTIDHLCMNPRCVNPAHLEVVTRAENARRQAASGRARGGAQNRAKTHCPQGHAYDVGNTHLYAGRRSCRACARERARRARSAS
mgnify:CR=1 FL=1